LELSGSWFAFNLLVVSFIRSKSPNFLFQSFLLALFFILVLLGRAWSREFQLARLSRVSPASPRSALFEVAERFRDQGWDTRDLLILDTDGDSEWQTYGFLFVSGVETRTLGQLRDFAAKRPDFEAFARQRYRRIGTLHQIRGYSLSACPVPLKLPDCLF